MSSDHRARPVLRARRDLSERLALRAQPAQLARLGLLAQRDRLALPRA
jgi:hypothetical protein